MLCVHEGSYKTKDKSQKENKITSTIRIGCKANIYARKETNIEGVEKIIIKKVSNIHNHEALTEDEYKTAPQVVELKDESKQEALKYFKEGEKIANIAQTILQKYYNDDTDIYTTGAIKKKLVNYLNNQSKNIEALNLNKIVANLSGLFIYCLSSSLLGYNEDIVWMSFKKDSNIEVIFFTFKPLVKECKKFYANYIKSLKPMNITMLFSLIVLTTYYQRRLLKRRRTTLV